MMLPSSTVTNPNIKSRSYRISLLNTDHLSTAIEEDEVDLDETSDFPNTDTILPQLIPPTTAPISIRSWTNLSEEKTKKRYSSRLYKFVQLEKALQSANLLNSTDERKKFEQDYHQSLQKDKFREFLQTYYRKIQIHKEEIAREQTMKTSRTFTFVDLEKNFLALDPTHDVKIVFVNHPKRFLPSNQQHSMSGIQCEDAAVETFYENLSRRLLNNPSRARDEITHFARQTSERLQEYIPCLSHVPYRVKIIDERDKEHSMDEQALLKMKHRQNLAVIEKRRQKIMKMIVQTRKNQIKMKQLDKRAQLTIDNSTYCKELLERVHEIEENIKEKPRRTRSVSQKMNSIHSSSLTTSQTVTPTSSIRQSPPFEDALSMYQIEKSNKVHVIQSTRPFTSPVKKPQWINYC
ncbi:hypothetical protein I4U23_001465 [Adineta vaga]|nr:hypothetical protein I4U23_001465 [Adineta vaga]